ncbi:MAG: T9SS type A sorting domain-containing protein, partial [Bacteroidota bacterium]
DEFILWFKDMPDFWSQIKKALDAPAQEDEIQTAVSVESIPTYPPVNLHAMKAFPNPASNQLSVEVTLTESDDISLNLLDLNGRLVKTLIPIQRQYQKNQIHSLTLPPIPSGVYVLVLDTQRGGRMTQRLNIQ